MNTRTILIAVVALFLGIAIGSVFLPSTDDFSFMGGEGGMMARNIDRHFIEEMIPHHEGAIEMAELALSRSKRPEIQSLAAGIKEAQEKENKDMRTWYQAWFGTSVPEYSGGMMSGMMHGNTGMMGGMMGENNMIGGMSGDLEALKAADDFDLEFIRQMIPHHEMAIMMARMLLSGTNREEMRVLADQIITSQAREIDMMRSWYNEWK